MAEAGIATNVHYKPPAHDDGLQKIWDLTLRIYPNAYHMFENEITLPLHTCLTDEQVEYIIETYRKIIKEL